MDKLKLMAYFEEGYSVIFTAVGMPAIVEEVESAFAELEKTKSAEIREIAIWVKLQKYKNKPKEEIEELTGFPLPIIEEYLKKSVHIGRLTVLKFYNAGYESNHAAKLLNEKETYIYRLYRCFEQKFEQPEVKKKNFRLSNKRIIKRKKVYDLFVEGYSVEEIALKSGYAIESVRNYLRPMLCQKEKPNFEDRIIEFYLNGDSISEVVKKARMTSSRVSDAFYILSLNDEYRVKREKALLIRRNEKGLEMMKLREKGMKAREIAEVFGLTTGTVNQKISEVYKAFDYEDIKKYLNM